MERPDRGVPESGASRTAMMSRSELDALRAELASAPHFPSPSRTTLSLQPAEPPRDDEQAWMLTYLDMLTLVLVLFVVLLAYTQPEAEEALSWTEGSLIELVHYQNPSIEPPLSDELPTMMHGNAAVELPIPELPPALEAAMKQENRLDGVEVHATPGRVELRVQDGVLFDSGDADLHLAGQRLMNRLAPMLSGTPGRIAVEGHTDDVPIENEHFPSNWELSAARASGVVRYLISRGLEPGRLQAVGFADTRPVAGNDSPGGRAANRRVALVIQTGPEASP